jgi:hypothetical protein
VLLFYPLAVQFVPSDTAFRLAPPDLIWLDI